MHRSNSETIILFYPPTHHEKNYRFFWIPFSILSVAALLKKQRIIILDGNAKSNWKDEILKMLETEKIMLVGVSSMIGHQIREGLEFAKMIKKNSPELPIIWGGSFPTVLPQLILVSDCCDVVVRGQGELSLRDIVAIVSRYGRAYKGYLKGIKGISYKKDNELIHNPPREFVDINSFPPYPLELVKVKEYVRNDEHINTRTLNYVSSQGCPFRCGFCSEGNMHRGWYGLKVRRIINDVMHFVNRFNINGIKFYDSDFFIDIKRALEFASMLIKYHLSIKWGAPAYPKILLKLDEDDWLLLKKSGLMRVHIGAESGNVAELRFIQKNVTPEDITNIAKIAAKYGIIMNFAFMVGFPGFTESNIEKTLRFAETLRKIYPRHELKVHFFTPYPGTPLWKHALSQGFKPPKNLSEWSHYDYYEITTPWVKPKWFRIIKEFNKEHCPYVSD